MRLAESIELNFQVRKPGAKYAKSARQDGLIPVVLYGLNKENEYFNLPKTDFSKLVFGHESALFNINIGRKKNLNAIIKDYVFDTLKNEYLHLDFMQVDSKELIEVMVPLRFIGEPIGVKNFGGILNKVLDEVKVECLPNFIPSVIEVDVTLLDLGEKIMVIDLELPPNVNLISDKDLTVAVIHLKSIEDQMIQEETLTDIASPYSENT